MVTNTDLQRTARVVLAVATIVEHLTAVNIDQLHAMTKSAVHRDDLVRVVSLLMKAGLVKFSDNIITWVELSD